MNYLWGGMILVGILYGGMTGRIQEVTDAALTSSKEAVSLCIAMAGITAMWVGIMKVAEEAGLIAQITRKISPLLQFLFPSIPKEHPARKHIAMNMIANFLGLGWAATPAGLKAMEALAELEEERRGEGTESRREDYREGQSGRKEATLAAEERHSGNGEGGVGEKRGRSGKGNDGKNEGVGMPLVKKGRLGMPRGVASNEMCTFLIINISSLQLIPVNVIAYRSQYGSVNPAAIVGPAIVATMISTLVGVVFAKVMDRKKRRA